jgi:hypothetical protein
MKRTALLFLLAAGLLETCRAATLTIPLGGALIAYPGDTVGWSFTIESTAIQDGPNTITPWLMITAVDWVLDPAVAPPGIFTPFLTLLPNSNTVIGPDTGNGEVNPWTQVFDLNLGTGIGSYAVNDPVDPGKYLGQIVINYDAFRVSPYDPLFDPQTDTIDVGQSLTHAASIRIDPVPSADVPEPAPSLLTACWLAMLVAYRRRS